MNIYLSIIYNSTIKYIHYKMAKRDYDHLFKLVLVGDSGVGKSCLLLRYADDAFTESFISTIGVDFRFRSAEISGKRIKLQIWDTAGQERFRTITTAYYRGADGIIFVYDITHKESFDHMSSWLAEARRYATPGIPMIIVGNKSDRTDRVVLESDLKKFAQDNDALYIECSARTGDDVKDLFENMAKRLIAIREKDEKPDTGETVDIDRHIPARFACC